MKANNFIQIGNTANGKTGVEIVHVHYVRIVEMFGSCRVFTLSKFVQIVML